MVQVPVVRAVTVEPLTVHTAGVVELNVTPRAEVAVALAVVVPFTTIVDGAKLMLPMVWLSLLGVMFAVTWVAAE